MKKILAVILSTIMVCSISVIAYADKQKAYSGQVVPEDPVSLFIESLDKSLKAGTYLDNSGEFVLAVTDLEKANSLIAKANLPTKIKVVEVEYSMAELEAARDKLFNNSQNFDIQIVALDASKNGLAVFTSDYSDANKKSISNYVATSTNKKYDTQNSNKGRTQKMDVVFYNNKATSVPAMTNRFNDSENSSALSAKALSTVKSGVYLKHNQYSNAESTVGWRISVNGVTGYTTCGHNWSANSNSYYESNLLGKVSKNVFGPRNNTDVSFIPSNVPFYGMRGDGKKITHAGSPVQGGTIIFDGARHYQDVKSGEKRIKAKITATDGIAYMTDTLGRSATLTDMIVFDDQPWFGDSGAAIIQERDGKVILVGFNSCQYKGPKDDPNSTTQWSYGAAVTWVSVRDALGGSSVVLPMN